MKIGKQFIADVSNGIMYIHHSWLYWNMRFVFDATIFD